MEIKIKKPLDGIASRFNAPQHGRYLLFPSSLCVKTAPFSLSLSLSHTHTKHLKFRERTRVSQLQISLQWHSQLLLLLLLLFSLAARRLRTTSKVKSLALYNLNSVIFLFIFGNDCCSCRLVESLRFLVYIRKKVYLALKFSSHFNVSFWIFNFNNTFLSKEFVCYFTVPLSLYQFVSAIPFVIFSTPICCWNWNLRIKSKLDKDVGNNYNFSLYIISDSNSKFRFYFFYSTRELSESNNSVGV